MKLYHNISYANIDKTKSKKGYSMSNTTLIDTIELAGTKSGKITVANINEPYGENSEEVTSIGISLVGDDIEWKVHIPKKNLDELIEVLEKAK